MNDKLLTAAEHMDWQQVQLNGGPPCFYLEHDGYFCGRAARWTGHVGPHSGRIHKFVSLKDLLKSCSANKPLPERSSG